MGVYPSMLCATADKEDAAPQTECCLVRAGFVPDPQRNELQLTLVDGWRLAVI